MQSYNPAGERFSLSDILFPIRRQYRSITALRDSFKCSASRPISTSLIHTYPGPPVQQLPHCVQVNVSPSAYQGLASFELSSTFNFMFGTLAHPVLPEDLREGFALLLIAEGALGNDERRRRVIDDQIEIGRLDD